MLQNDVQQHATWHGHHEPEKPVTLVAEADHGDRGEKADDRERADGRERLHEPGHGPGGVLVAPQR